MAQDDKLDEVARLVGDRQDLIDVVRLLHAAQVRRPDRRKETGRMDPCGHPRRQSLSLPEHRSEHPLVRRSVMHRGAIRPVRVACIIATDVAPHDCRGQRRPCGRDCPFLFHWLSVDRWRPLRSAAGCSRTLSGVRRRVRRGWHVIAECEDGNSGHHDPDDKSRQEPSATISVNERSLSVRVQTWIGLLRLLGLSV
jgi:hypothetical protein